MNAVYDMVFEGKKPRTLVILLDLRDTLFCFLVAVFAVFAVLAIPIIRGIMSVLTPADQQGGLFHQINAPKILYAK